MRKALHALVLMECIQQPQLRSEAASSLMQGIAQGQLGDRQVTSSLMYLYEFPCKMLCAIGQMSSIIRRKF